VLNTLLSVVGIAIPTAIVGVVAVWPLALCAAAVVALGLTLWAGFRLQRERDNRLSVQFSIDAVIETLGDSQTRGSETYGHRQILWLRVRNRGPAASFSADCSSVAAAKPIALYSFDGQWEGGKVAWEDTPSDSLVINRNSVAKLMLVEWFSIPKALFWTRLPAAHAWSGSSHALGWILSPDAMRPQIPSLCSSEMTPRIRQSTLSSLST
jgi:hypothetical protein